MLLLRLSAARDATACAKLRCYTVHQVPSAWGWTTSPTALA